MGAINPSRIKTSQLRALVAIADLGTFSDAALNLDLSQSAVSHAIATLEDELGVVLLNRSRQGASLTPLGRQITQEARRSLQSLDTIGRLAQQARGLHQGQVRIAGFRSVATHVLPEVISKFRSTYPDLTVTINECQHYQQIETEVRHGRADIGFTYLPTSPEFDAWELLRDRYVALLPPQFAHTPVVSWQTLTQTPLILAPSGDCCRDLIQRYFAAAGYSLTPAYEVKEDSTIISLVQQGLGITIMAQLAAEPIPPELQVAELPVQMERIIGVIQMTDALLPPPVFAFVDLLKQVWSTSELAMQSC
jgi:DNA-binding transcriptional LysR family regulator